MNVLIVGGSSGLGLALAKEFADQKDQVIVTGRHDPKNVELEFKLLDMVHGNLPSKVDELVSALPNIDVLVYSAGAYPYGRVTDFTPAEIEASINVAGTGLIYFARALLLKQGSIDEVITITSVAQWQPKQKEVIYDFVKAGAGHFSNGLAEDGRVGKVLVVAPASLKNEGESGNMLSRDWVTSKIFDQRKGDFKYKFIKLLLNPQRVEIAETR